MHTHMQVSPQADFPSFGPLDLDKGRATTKTAETRGYQGPGVCGGGMGGG